MIATGGATVVEERTDTGGRFTLAVPHGAYTIQVRAPDGHARSRALHASAGDHAIQVVLP